MKTSALLLGLVGLSFAALGGCTQEVSDGSSEDTVAEEGLTQTNFGYFIVTHRDMRKCMVPMCGSFFVKRVNEATTLCADGARRAECYVSSIQLTSIKLSAREESDFRASLEGGKALVRAAIYKQKWNGTVLGTLKANEAWVAATGSTPDGTFYRAADNGIRCIKAPCPTTTAYELNGHDTQNVINVILDQTATPADPESLDRAHDALGTKEGVLLAGSILVPKCMPAAVSCGPVATASEFYLAVKHREGKTCGTRGASLPCGIGQYCAWDAAGICGAADAPGTCSYRPEMCTAQYDPVCGCDGKTHSNACNAAAAGTSVASAGPCP